MSSPGFLLDENVPLVIQAQLQQREPAMLLYTVGDGVAPPRGTPDPEILAWAEIHQCLLITNNRATMPVHLRAYLAQGQHVPGIIQLPRRLNLGRILDDLWLIWSAAQPDEFKDQIIYLPLRN